MSNKKILIPFIILLLLGLIVYMFLKFNPEILMSQNELKEEMKKISAQKDIEFINCDIIDSDNVKIEEVSLTVESKDEILNLGVQQFRNIDTFDDYFNKYEGDFDQSKVFEIMNLFDEDYFNNHSVIIYPYKKYKNEFSIDVIKNIELKDNKFIINKIVYSFDAQTEDENNINVLIIPINDNQATFDGIKINSDYTQDMNLVKEYLKLYKIYDLKNKF